MNEEKLVAAHRFSINHKKDLSNDKKCVLP